MSKFIYKLNAMEHASQADQPHKMGYADKRKAVLDHVQNVERDLQAAQSRLARYEQAANEPEDRAIGVEMNGAVWVDKKYYDALRDTLVACMARIKEFDPDPVVCECREACCPHTPIAKLPRQELVNHFRQRIKNAEAELTAALAACRVELADAREQRGTLAYSTDAGWSPLGEQIIRLENELAACRVELAVIHKQWKESNRQHANKENELTARVLTARAQERERERCAKVCEDLWKSAPNDRERSHRQNLLSHGCLASAAAIRALEAPEQNCWAEGQSHDFIGGKCIKCGAPEQNAAGQVTESAPPSRAEDSIGAPAAAAPEWDILAGRSKGHMFQSAPDHPYTDQCGFDRNESISEGRYVCTCGWSDRRQGPRRITPMSAFSLGFNMRGLTTRRRSKP